MASALTTTGVKRMRDHAAAADPQRPEKKRRRKQAQKQKHKHAQHAHEDAAAMLTPPTHAVLSQYYVRLQTLRDHVLESLPSSSKLRRRKIASLGKLADDGDGRQPSDLEMHVSHLLDSTIVASSRDSKPARADSRWNQWLNFSQRGDESYVSLSDGATKTLFCQHEIVNFAIWSLFEKDKRNGGWPKNVLCDGFRRAPAWDANPPPAGACLPADAVPGLFSVYPNQHVRMLKDSFWPELLGLLGQAGEKIMIDLLLDHSVFVSVHAGSGNYYQLSGKAQSQLAQSLIKNGPLTGLVREISQRPRASCIQQPSTGELPKWPGPGQLIQHGKVPCYDSVCQKPHALLACCPERAWGCAFRTETYTYVRGSRSIPTSTVHGSCVASCNVSILQRSDAELCADVLNRYPFAASSRPASMAGEEDEISKDNWRNTLHCMMYMFPRQFSLHNAFTSVVDSAKTTQKLQDYTLREDEIQQKFRLRESELPPLPKRLRGSTYQLVQKLQILHKRCSYSALLQHYCPDPRLLSTAASEDDESEGHNTSTLDLSSPVSHVSAYCQAVLSKIIPTDFWGTGNVQIENKRRFLKHVDHFVKLRRFETMNLHELKQGFKITEIGWLAPPGAAGQKTSRTDMGKRTEIFLEFLYYLFDSLLIPLLRSNFYITESSSHRSRLFYFRHDVWRSIAEPAMSTLKDKMFDEVRPAEAQSILSSRDLGCSQVRLLPKDSGMRPITNLRRRTPLKGSKKALGPSINAVLGPVHSMLKLEKELHPSRLGSSMLSVGDLYLRLKVFKERLGPRDRPFFFAKVDVQAAFDTIPQAAILKLMANVPSLPRYKVVKHVEIEAEPVMGGGSTTNPRLSKRWRSAARDAADSSSFMDMLVDQVARSKTDTIFVDSVVQKTHRTQNLIRLLVAHIEQNLVRIGKKHYRQKVGIPQGSILSSLLCNYFYADLESKHLRFLQSDDCLLLRLIDDFLLITTDVDKASRFVEVMHAGVPEYGVSVNPDKTLVNFSLGRGGAAVARPEARSRGEFPYCGTLINCTSLGVRKDRARRPRDPVVVANSLTVDFSRHQGRNFQRKVAAAFRIQSHLMFFDTAHGSHRAALRNLAAAMAETAAKTWAYVRCLPPARRPRPAIVTAAIDGVAGAAYALLTSRSRRQRFPDYVCDLGREQVRGVTLHAFKQVLGKRQSCFREVLAWLDTEIQGLRVRSAAPGPESQ
ncbi:hypothetical protein RB593_002150 [Gaeumannomyces tritici]